MKLEGTYAADAGVLIDLVYGTTQGAQLKQAMISEHAALITHEIALTELRYILCRKVGQEAAWSRVEKLLASGYIIVEDISILLKDAAAFKCTRRIALPDCFTLALASHMQVTALFASKETEIIREMENNPFPFKVQFLEE